VTSSSQKNKENLTKDTKVIFGKIIDTDQKVFLIKTDGTDDDLLTTRSNLDGRARNSR
jgi:hypothetical protein